MKRYALLCLLAILLIVPLTTVLGQQQAETIIYGISADVQNFNMVIKSNTSIVNMILPILYDSDPITGVPINGGQSLSSWTASDDGLVYTFTIRDDANWSDGMPVSANDVKFTFDAIASDAVQTPFKSNLASIEAIEVVDEKTFTVTLKKPDCTVLNSLWLYFLPEHKFAPDFSDFMTAEFNTNPDIAAGPYLLDEWAPDEFIRLKANPTYYKGEPKIPYLLYRIIPDPSSLLQALRVGEVDALSVEPTQLDQLGDAINNFDSYNFPADSIGYIIYNHANPDNPQPGRDEAGNLIEQDPHPIFGDVRVRQALAMGWDKAGLLDSLGGEAYGQLTLSTIVPAYTWAYNSDIAPWTYDAERAAALLDEAGWIMNDATGVREKDGNPLEFDLIVLPGVQAIDLASILMQDQLGQLGVQVNLQTLEFTTAIADYLGPQKFDAIIIGFGAPPPPDPNTISYFILHSTSDVPFGFNQASYDNPEVDRLLDAAREVPGCNTEERGMLYKEIQALAANDVAYDVLYALNTTTLINKRIQGVELGPWELGAGTIQNWSIEQ